MQHLDAIFKKSDYFVSNNLVSLDKEASNSGKEYYLVGAHKISVWIDEHGRFNCNECGGYKKDAICSHVLASLMFRNKQMFRSKYDKVAKVIEETIRESNPELMKGVELKFIPEEHV